MTELKPCPFCGGGANVSKIYYIHEYKIICNGCGASFYPFCATSEKSAIEAWNRRAENGCTD